MSEGERLAYFTAYTTQLKEKAIADSLALVKEEEGFRSNEFLKVEIKGIQMRRVEAFIFTTQLRQHMENNNLEGSGVIESWKMIGAGQIKQ